MEIIGLKNDASGSGAALSFGTNSLEHILSYEQLQDKHMFSALT
jgi:hypothetical protein